MKWQCQRWPYANYSMCQQCHERACLPILVQPEASSRLTDAIGRLSSKPNPRALPIKTNGKDGEWRLAGMFNHIVDMVVGAGQSMPVVHIPDPLELDPSSCKGPGARKEVCEQRRRRGKYIDTCRAQMNALIVVAFKCEEGERTEGCDASFAARSSYRTTIAASWVQIADIDHVLEQFVSSTPAWAEVLYRER